MADTKYRDFPSLYKKIRHHVELGAYAHELLGSLSLKVSGFAAGESKDIPVTVAISISESLRHVANLCHFLGESLSEDSDGLVRGIPRIESRIGIDTCRQRDFNGTVPGRRP